MDHQHQHRVAVSSPPASWHGEHIPHEAIPKAIARLPVRQTFMAATLHAECRGPSCRVEV